jgi:hypothetical protein
MTCSTTRRHLLACERPDEPPPEVREHLADCPECRAVQRRLVLAEQQLRALAVPPSPGRDAFVRQFLAPGGVRPRPSRPGTVREGARRKVALAFALAAGLAMFALGLWAWPHGDEQFTQRTQGPSTPSAREAWEKRVRSLEALVDGGERVRGLADLADELHQKARSLRDDSDGLEEVALLYADLVKEHLVVQAKKLAPAERRGLKAVAERLQQAESQAARLAAELRAGAADRARSFDRIAAAASSGSRELLALAPAARG